MSDGCTPTLARLSGLQRLHLDTRAVGDAGLQALAAATKLTYLDLFGAKVTDKGCISLRQVLQAVPSCIWDVMRPDFSKLHLILPATQQQWYPEVADKAVVLCSHLVGLQSLEMCGGAVTDAGVVHLAPLGRLTHLSLAHNTRVTDVSLPVFQGMTELVFLNLTRSRLTGPGIQRLAGLSVRPCTAQPLLNRASLLLCWCCHSAGATNAVTAAFESVSMAEWLTVGLVLCRSWRSSSCRTRACGGQRWTSCTCCCRASRSCSASPGPLPRTNGSAHPQDCSSPIQ